MSQERKQYQLTIDENQARILIQALDLYSRLGIGQYEEAVSFLKWQSDPRLEGKHEECDKAMKHLNEIKMLLFNMPSNASYGIYSEKVPDCFRAAWDILKVIRHQLWKDNENRSDFTVDAYPADQSTKDQPLAKIEALE